MSGDQTNGESGTNETRRPLEGVRVIDAGNLVAVPFATRLLADFGAEVIKIEHPEYGDGLRELEPHKDDVPLWWKVTSRNKKGITLNLSTEKGREVFLDLVADADIVAENFRPGTLERWNLGPETLYERNPSLVLLRISGYGQTGPKSDEPGFGRIAGAMSGMTNLIGEADGPPMTPGYPLGDGVSGMMGAFASLVALRHAEETGEGQMIDLALYEALFNMLEFTAIEYDQLGNVRKRTGNQHPYVAPSSTYQSADGEYVSMTASTQSIWRRLCRAIDREELVEDPRFEDNASRVEHADEINGIVADWVEDHTREEVEETFDEHGVAYSFVYDVADAFEDEHYRARDALVDVEDDELGETTVQGVVPKLEKTPGAVDSLGPKKGQHNEEVYRDLLEYPEEMIEELREDGIV
jgi:formyl-CoA transferase